MLEIVDNKEKAEQPTVEQSVARFRNRPVPEGARLLDLHQAAVYLGLSYWTVRDYVTEEIIPVVKLPCGRQRDRVVKLEDGRERISAGRKAGVTSARKILIDKQDLDALIERSKETLG